jgi:hypothetical protein
LIYIFDSEALAHNGSQRHPIGWEEMIYSSFSSWRRPPRSKRQPTAALATLPGKQQRVQEIREAMLYTVDARVKRNLQSELTEVEQFIQHCVPISKLPHDILAELAYVFSKVQNNGAWLFSAVCRTWRVAALCNPRAWTDIHLAALEDTSNSFKSKAIPHHPLQQTPNPVLCISRAGVLPLSLEFHGPITTTRNMEKFLSKVIPYVGRLCFHERGGCSLPVSRAIDMPKLRQLIILPEKGDTTSGYNEVERVFSNVLFQIFGTNDLAKCTRALTRLWVARFHKIHWDAEYFVGFRQLRDLTLHDCTCSPSDNIPQFLRATCETLEHLHLSLTLSDEIQDWHLARICFPRLLTFSFNIARRAQNSYRSNQSPPFIMHSQYITLFQSLIAPVATELQVYAPYIEDLEISAHYPSLQHLRIIIPVTMDDVFSCATSLKSLILSSPLRALDLFISTNHYKLPEREYGIAAILSSFLCDPLVLDHCTFTTVNIKLRPDFEPVWDQVSYLWMRRGKTLRIQSATNLECIKEGFIIIHDPAAEDIREWSSTLASGGGDTRIISLPAWEVSQLYL